MEWSRVEPGVDGKPASWPGKITDFLREGVRAVEAA